MGDALRHFLPRGRLLSFDQFREVFEDEHEAQIPSFFVSHAGTAQPDRQEFTFHVHGTFQREAVPRVGEHTVVRVLEQVQPQLFERLGDGSPTKLVAPRTEDTFRRRVEGGDEPRPVDREDAGGHGVHDRLRVGTAAIQFQVR